MSGRMEALCLVIQGCFLCGRRRNSWCGCLRWLLGGISSQATHVHLVCSEAQSQEQAGLWTTGISLLLETCQWISLLAFPLSGISSHPVSCSPSGFEYEVFEWSLFSSLLCARAFWGLCSFLLRPRALQEEVVSLLWPHVCTPGIRRIFKTSEEKKSAQWRMRLRG